MINRQDITAVILAGGRSQRMGSRNKGLLELHGRALIEHVIVAIRPQVGQVLINANTDLDRFNAFGYEVIMDDDADYRGPLAGIVAAMAVIKTPYLLIAPCDTPHLPVDLVTRLAKSLQQTGAHLSVVHDGLRIQPLCALLHKDLAKELNTAMETGAYKAETWVLQQQAAMADFSDCGDGFININTPEDLAMLTDKTALSG